MKESTKEGTIIIAVFVLGLLGLIEIIIRTEEHQYNPFDAYLPLIVLTIFLLTYLILEIFYIRTGKSLEEDNQPFSDKKYTYLTFLSDNFSLIAASIAAVLTILGLIRLCKISWWLATHIKDTWGWITSIELSLSWITPVAIIIAAIAALLAIKYTIYRLIKREK